MVCCNVLINLHTASVLRNDNTNSKCNKLSRVCSLKFSSKKRFVQKIFSLRSKNDYIVKRSFFVISIASGWYSCFQCEEGWIVQSTFHTQDIVADDFVFNIIYVEKYLLFKRLFMCGFWCMFVYEMIALAKHRPTFVDALFFIHVK